MSVKPELYDVIRKPIVTEKATMASESGAVVFEVAIESNKPQIKEAVESLFGVKVKAVNTTADFFGGSNDNGFTHIAFLDTTARDGFLHRNDDHVAHGCVFTLGTTQHFDALYPACAGVISYIQIGLHLDHSVSPDLWGAFTCSPGFRLN